MSDVVSIELKHRTSLRNISASKSVKTIKAEILINNVPILSGVCGENEDQDVFMFEMRDKVYKIFEALKISGVESVVEIVEA